MIHQEDSERITRNFKEGLEHCLERGRYRQALSLTVITFRDLWVSAHEYKWSVQKRSALHEKVKKYNFENNVKNDIDAL
jgi:hypothetical protein